ncbi:MAG: hypothetical protein R6V03_09855, partial [Kiritimatiellia bacterium]
AVRTMAIKKETMKEFGKDLHCIGDRLPLGNMSFASTHPLSPLAKAVMFMALPRTNGVSHVCEPQERLASRLWGIGVMGNRGQT